MSEDLLVAVREKAAAGDGQAATCAKNLARAVRRRKVLGFAIEDLAERSQRPTIPEQKRAAYARTLEECRTELPLVEAQLNHWTARAAALTRED